MLHTNGTHISVLELHNFLFGIILYQHLFLKTSTQTPVFDNQLYSCATQIIIELSATWRVSANKGNPVFARGAAPMGFASEYGGFFVQSIRFPGNKLLLWKSLLRKIGINSRINYSALRKFPLHVAV